MRRSEFRENVITLLYVELMNGEYNIEEQDKEVLKRISEITNNLEDIDDIIKNNLERYTIDRLNYVDLAICRNAVYEIKYTKLPCEIVINEALNLTKKFSNLDDDSAKRFNNKLLDNICKYIHKKWKDNI
jgi:N utilization substance protein B